MKKIKRISPAFCIATIIGAVTVCLFCTEPLNPFEGAEDATVHVVLKNHSITTGDSLSDSIGNAIHLGYVYVLPEFIDSVTCLISGSRGLERSFGYTAEEIMSTDTQWTQLSFDTPGTRHVEISAYRKTGSVRHRSLIIEMVDRKPFLTGQSSKNLAIESGQACTLRVDAYGAPPLSYRWFFNESEIDEAVDSFLVVQNIDDSDTGEYYCVVESSTGKTVHSDTFKITMKVNNTPPDFIDNFPAARYVVTTGETLHIPFAAYDADEDSVVFFIEETTIPGFDYALLPEHEIRWKPTMDDAGSYTLQAAVTDLIDTTFIAVEIAVIMQNRAPTFIEGYPPLSVLVPPGDTLKLPLKASDPDDDSLIYVISGHDLPGDGPQVAGDTLVWVTDSLDQGTFSVALGVTDNTDTVNTTVTITMISTSEENSAPAFVTGAYNRSYIISEGDGLEIRISATDADQDPVEFFIDSCTLPAWDDTALSDSVLTWQAPVGRNGEYILIIGATDQIDTVLDTIEIALNGLPEIVLENHTSGDTLYVKEGSAGTYQINVEDDEDDPIELTIEEMPFQGPGHGSAALSDGGALSFYPSFRVCPDTNDVVLGPLTIIASEAVKPFGADTFVVFVAVSDSNSAPRWSRDSITVEGKEKAPLRIMLNEYFEGDAEGDDVSFACSFGQIDISDTSWWWVPEFNDNGEHVCVVHAIDDHNPKDSSHLIITALVSDSIRPLDVDISEKNIEMDEGAEKRIVAKAVDPDGQISTHIEVLWPLNMPSWITAHTEVDSIVLNVNPDFELATSESPNYTQMVIFRAKNDMTASLDTVFITVSNNNRPPQWVWKPLDTVSVEIHTLFETAIRADDPDLEDNIQYRIENAPGGMIIEGERLIWFADRNTYSAQQSFTVSLSAFDGEAYSDEINFTIVCTPHKWNVLAGNGRIDWERSFAVAVGDSNSLFVAGSNGNGSQIDRFTPNSSHGNWDIFKELPGTDYSYGMYDMVACDSELAIFFLKYRANTCRVYNIATQDTVASHSHGLRMMEEGAFEINRANGNVYLSGYSGGAYPWTVYNNGKIDTLGNYGRVVDFESTPEGVVLALTDSSVYALNSLVTGSTWDNISDGFTGGQQIVSDKKRGTVFYILYAKNGTTNGILKYSNGDRLQVALPASINPVDICMINEKTGWLVSADGEIYSTNNGFDDLSKEEIEYEDYSFLQPFKAEKLILAEDGKSVYTYGFNSVSCYLLKY